MGGYTRKFRKTYTVHGVAQGTVSYPASQNGGTKSVAINYSVDVPFEVDCHIDTNPFEKSVQGCNLQIDALTTSVVATQTAEVRAKRENAEKVGGQLISGFFGYIRSEISQQISELKATISSQLVHLLKLKENCESKQEVMKNDYHRIASRYRDIFTDLDEELKNRVFQLDKPAFGLVEEICTEINRPANDMLLNTVTVGNAETMGLESVLCSSRMKDKTRQLLYSGQSFLRQNRRLKEGIEAILTHEKVTGPIFVPVLYTEGNDDRQGTVSRLYYPPLEALERNSGKIAQLLDGNNRTWTEMEEAEREGIEGYLKREMSREYSNENPHKARVSQLIFSMWKNTALQVLSGN